MRSLIAVPLLFWATLFCGAVAAQTPSFEINVAGHPPLTLSATDVAAMPQHTIHVTEHGQQVIYTGILVSDVLVKAGVPMGTQLKGKALSSYLLATARDGYAVIYALPEFDSAFTDAEPLIATQSGGKPLDENQGPFRMVMPQDKKPARSLRMLQKIEVVQLVK